MEIKGGKVGDSGCFIAPEPPWLIPRAWASLFTLFHRQAGFPGVGEKMPVSGRGGQHKLPGRVGTCTLHVEVGGKGSEER